MVAMVFQPMIAPWAILTVALVAAGSLWFYYVRDAALDVRKKRVLITLRAAGILVIILMLMGPSREKVTTLTHKSALSVVVDVSASMARADSGDGDKARLDAARSALGVVLERLAETYDVRLFAMGESAGFAAAGDQTRISDALSRMSPVEDATGLGDALIAAAPRESSSAVLILSDGASNTGASAAAAASILAARDVRVFAAAFGQTGRPNIAVTRVLGPKVLLKDEPSAFFAEVRATGGQAFPVEVTLSEGAKVISRATAVGTGPVRLDFTPQAEGDIAYTINAEAAPGEEMLADNTASRTVRVAKQKLKVLYVEDEPRWEYRFIKNAILRDDRLAPELVLISGDAEAQAVASFPHTRQALFAFDCVVIGDVEPGYFLPRDLDNLRAFVSEGGGGILFVGGARYNPAAYTTGALAELVPADYAGVATMPSEGWAIALTDAGAANPALTLSGGDQNAFYARLPHIEWLMRTRPRPAAKVLAVSEPGGMGVITEQPFGRGATMLVATDELWRWRSLGGDRYLYRLWAQLVRYLGSRRLSGGAAAGELALSADEYPRGTMVSATAYLEDALGMPYSEPTAEGFVEGETGARLDVTLSRDTGGGGLYRADFPAVDPGRYKVYVRAPGGVLEASYTVLADSAERLAADAEPEALATLAAGTGGVVLSEGDLGRIFDLYSGDAPEEKTITREPLWANYLFLLPVAVFFSLEWFLRKRWGQP